jgi:plastocyanin
MKKYLVGLGVIVAVGFLMILPYILREISPVEQAEEEVVQEGATEVEIRDFAFSPTKISVKKGTSVLWVNKNTVGHTITGDRGGPDSSVFDKDKSYTFVFDKAGVFDYHCTPHPFMRGTVEVVE